MIWQRYQQSGSTNDRPRSGHPRITIHVQDCYIRVFQLKNRTETASQTSFKKTQLFWTWFCLLHLIEYNLYKIIYCLYFLNYKLIIYLFKYNHV
jgi:hypothetical protein